MNKLRLRQIIGVGVGWGLVVSLQQTAISVIVASVQEFDRFPFLSIVALSFIFVMSSFILMAWLGLVSLLVSRFKFVKKLHDGEWLGVLNGGVVGFWLFCLLDRSIQLLRRAGLCFLILRCSRLSLPSWR